MNTIIPIPQPLRALLWLLALASWFPLAVRSASTLSRDRLLEFENSRHEVRQAVSWSGWNARKRDIRDAMQSIMGALPNPAKRCALETQIEEKVACEGYERWRISYQVVPGHRVPAYLLIPDRALKGSTKCAGVLTLHQTHAEGQKVVVGLGKSPDDEYGVELARRGYVCLAPPYPMLANYWPSPRDLGFESGTMLGVWINIRGLDLLSSLPFVKRQGFGCIGHSLGGHNGMFTAAFDERISAVVSSCGLDSFRDYYDGDPSVWQPERGWCQTRYMPRLAAYRGRLADIPFDFAEVIACVAPRSVFISAPLGDANFRWRSVDRVGESARPVFALKRATGQLVIRHPDSPHRFPPAAREEAYRFLDAALQRRR
ncbi:MAG: alpha/beta hydrolase [Verrucomicrobia bacterium]|nr:alpha/beta hydrolase [Verrucomicrobiota bacterium]MBI3870878.1 alpha/beta hydrolase [Verrucomicrobiota bacterium]